MRLNLKYILQTLSGVAFIFFFCEYLIYYVVLMQCRWPELNYQNMEPDIGLRHDYRPIRAMLLADTHLLGSRKGHWFDKLRREWQMYRAFQTSIALHSPQVVFVLGDLFDEGLWCSDKEFQYYVKRFNHLFAVPEQTKLYVVAGNHDMGFHYGVSPFLMERFTSAFDAPAVRLLTIQGNHFVLINSMAMEGDGCFLCKPAELQLNNIEHRLKCTKGIGKCSKSMFLEQYSRPIVLQHYPLYRESDSRHCSMEADGAPEPDWSQAMRERWDCLSKESSLQLLDTLRPRLVFGGHTHHACRRNYTMPGGKITQEYSIPSFSWRNKDNPSFVLAVISPNNYAVSKCFMPKESTVFSLYLIGMASVIVWIILTHRRLYYRTSPYFYKRL